MQVEPLDYSQTEQPVINFQREEGHTHLGTWKQLHEVNNALLVIIK